MIRRKAVANLPAGYPVDVHFHPRYNPWDQRICLDADADLFTAISAGRAEIVTDHIDHVDETGIALKSGQHIDADIIVTATGLQLQALGGAVISLDGQEIKPQDRFVYQAHLLEDVPNLAWCVGYTNASWTLRADITARRVAKLLSFMHAHGYTFAYPHRDGEPMTGEVLVGHSSRVRAALTARAAQIGHRAAVERPAELLRRRHRPPLRPHRRTNGLRPRGRSQHGRRVTTRLPTAPTAGEHDRCASPDPGRIDRQRLAKSA